MRPKSLTIPSSEFAHAAHTPRVRGDPAIAAKKRGGRRFQFCDTGPTATPSTRSLRILLTAMPGIESESSRGVESLPVASCRAVPSRAACAWRGSERASLPGCKFECNASPVERRAAQRDELEHPTKRHSQKRASRADALAKEDAATILDILISISLIRHYYS